MKRREKNSLGSFYFCFWQINGHFIVLGFNFDWLVIGNMALKFTFECNLFVKFKFLSLWSISLNFGP